jgi:hypothetical protein
MKAPLLMIKFSSKGPSPCYGWPLRLHSDYADGTLGVRLWICPRCGRMGASLLYYRAASFSGMGNTSRL